MNRIVLSLVAAFSFLVAAGGAPSVARACGGYGPMVVVHATCDGEACRDAEVAVNLGGVRRVARTDENGEASFFFYRAGTATVAATFHRGDASERVGATTRAFKPFENGRVELE